VPAAPGRPAPISPLIRKHAHDLDVDLEEVRGSGRGGAITRADVERAAAQRQPAAGKPPGPAGARIKVTPRARRVAAELGVALTGVTGTGPGGSVREADVRRAAPAAEAIPVPEAAPAALAARSGAERTRSMRQAIARLMARSKREIPHYYVSNTVDMTISLDWLHERNRELEVSQRLVPAVLAPEGDHGPWRHGHGCANASDEHDKVTRRRP